MNRPLPSLLSVLIMSACATTGAPQRTTDTNDAVLGDRMVVEVTSGEVMSPSAVVADLRSVKHVYVGERHATPGYQATQLEVMRLLQETGQRVAVGVEWLPMERQGVIDAYIAGRIDEPEFVRRVDWKHVWGHNYSAYAPIFRYARAHKIPIWALGAPHGLARTVGRHGTKNLTPRLKAKLPPLNTRNRAHREFFEAMMSAVAHAHGGHGHGHKHHHHKPKRTKGESMMDRYYTAQVLRDEYMAQNLAKHMAKPEHSGRVALVFAGIGHTDFALGIPLRAAKLLDAPFRIILPIPNGSMDNQGALLKNKPYPRRRADYLWEAPKKRPHVARR